VTHDVSGEEVLGSLMARTGEAVRRVFDESDDARLLMSPDRRIVLVNQACERMFGRSRDQLVGRPARILTPVRLAGDYGRVYDALVAMDGSGTVAVNIWGLDSTGREFPVRMVSKLVQLSGPAAVLSVAVVDRSAGEGASQQLRDFLESAHDGNVIVDALGRIVMANARAEEIFGYAEEELVGERVEMLMPPGEAAGHAALRERFTSEARSHVLALGTRVVARRKDGMTFPVRVMLSSLGAGDDVLVSASVRDLTEIEHLRGESDRLKEQFLATVSHELRTPLTSILGSAEILAEEVERIDDEVLRGRLERHSAAITRGARRQMTLVEDLLTLTSIDRGAVGVSGHLADLLVVVENTVHTYLPRATAAGLELRSDHSALPVLVRADEGWLGRAVDCLVSNALKFTPPGGAVHVGAGEDDGLAWLEVSDTGPGIELDESEHVFRRLYRGRAAVAAEKPGAGIGLAIARSVVESCGGTLVVIADPAGARLRITLPLAADRKSFKG
jgi:PAS domain S-box-containing protein